MTVKKETSDGLTATTEQTPTTRQQEETNVEPQLNHRPQTEHEEPNSQPILAHFGLGVSAHQPKSYCFPKRQFGKSKPVFKNFRVAWFDNLAAAALLEDEDTVICHTRAHKTHQMATLMLDAAFITNGYSNWKDVTRKKVGFSQHETWPVSPGSRREKASPFMPRPKMSASTYHQPTTRIKLTIENVH